MPIHDTSVPISESMAVWEGQPSVAITHVRHLERGDHATVSRLWMNLHTGTHVDAQSHHYLGASGADSLDLETLVGPAYVADAHDAATLTAEVLTCLGIPAGSERVLIRTRNPALWSSSPGHFARDHVGLT